MSKTLNTIEELWLQCEYCHICRDNCRQITVSAGPEDQFALIYYTKEKNKLTLQCVYKKKFVANYTIDCVENTFTVNGNAPDLENIYYYFYIQSVCRQCEATHFHGSDLELNVKNKTVYNIGVESEGTYLLNTKDMYHVTMYYDTSHMMVSKCFKDKDGMILDENKTCKLPIVNLDFSNPQQAAHRIKTMLVFS